MFKLLGTDASPLRIQRRQSSVIPRTCCFCFDVRSGVVLIGLFNLVIHSAGLVMTSSILFHGRKVMVEEKRSTSAYGRLFEGAHYNNFYGTGIVKRSEVDHLLGMMIACLSFLFTAMLVYGAAARRAVYLLPFFCMQVFDLSLYALASFALLRFSGSIKLALLQNPQFRETVSHLTELQFLVCLIAVCVVILLLKVFLMSIVWDCFKYCRDHAKSLSPTIEAQPQEMEFMAGDKILVLPSYEDTIKVAPPPAYDE